MSKKISIEGKHLRWFIAGALRDYYKGVQMPESRFAYILSDTCNRVHRYLTEDRGLDGGASDIQCMIGTNARSAFGVQFGDEVTIYW